MTGTGYISKGKHCSGFVKLVCQFIISESSMAMDQLED